jgi:hypothetical protein
MIDSLSKRRSKKRTPVFTRLSLPFGLPGVYTPLRGTSRCCRDVKKLAEFMPLYRVLKQFLRLVPSTAVMRSVKEWV